MEEGHKTTGLGTRLGTGSKALPRPHLFSGPQLHVKWVPGEGQGTSKPCSAPLAMALDHFLRAFFKKNALVQGEQKKHLLRTALILQMQVQVRLDL
jgi:hypothetical protein